MIKKINSETRSCLVQYVAGSRLASRPIDREQCKVPPHKIPEVPMPHTREDIEKVGSLCSRSLL